MRQPSGWARLAGWGFGALAAGLLLTVADPAGASHFRGGSLTWEATGEPNEVVVGGWQAWRDSYFNGGGNTPGASLSVGRVDFGDGQSAPATLKVAAQSFFGDWVYGYLEPVAHTYAAPAAPGGPWNVTWTNCCRLGQATSQHHINNPDIGMRLAAQVDLAAPHALDALRSPAAPVAAIQACPLGGECRVWLPSQGFDPAEVTRRLATSAEATVGTGVSCPLVAITSPDCVATGDTFVQPGPPNAPHPATLDGEHLVWDTQNADQSDVQGAISYYSAQVVLSAGPGAATAVDFFIQLADPAQAPFWVIPPSPCGKTLSVPYGKALQFTASAASPDPHRLLEVRNLGLPAGAHSPDPAHANPASALFTWKPRLADLGDHFVTYTAVDDRGLIAPACVVRIHVQDPVPPVADFTPHLLQPHRRTVSFVDASHDSDGLIALWNWTLTPPAGPGKGFLCQAAAAPCGTTQSFAAPGLLVAELEVVDETGLSNRTVRTLLLPNHPPAIAAALPVTVPVGGSHTFTVGVSDPNGDAWSCALAGEAPMYLSFDAPTCAFTWMPPAPGTQQARVRATDAWGAWSERDFVFKAYDTRQDHDADGIADGADNCPMTENRAQRDADGDGLGDDCDAAAPPREDPKRVSGSDHDADGVPDKADNCPADANDGQEDLDGDGGGDLCDDDLDGDGVLQAGPGAQAPDNCPRLANPGQEDADGDGLGDRCDAPLAGAAAGNAPCPTGCGNTPPPVLGGRPLGPASAGAGLPAGAWWTPAILAVATAGILAIALRPRRRS